MAHQNEFLSTLSEIERLHFIHHHHHDEWDIRFRYFTKNRNCDLAKNHRVILLLWLHRLYSLILWNETLHFLRWQQQWTTDDNDGNFFFSSSLCFSHQPKVYSYLSHAAFGHCQPKRIWKHEKKIGRRKRNLPLDSTTVSRFLWFSVWKFRSKLFIFAFKIFFMLVNGNVKWK